MHTLALNLSNMPIHQLSLSLSHFPLGIARSCLKLEIGSDGNPIPKPEHRDLSQDIEVMQWCICCLCVIIHKYYSGDIVCANEYGNPKTLHEV